MEAEKMVPHLILFGAEELPDYPTLVACTCPKASAAGCGRLYQAPSASTRPERRARANAPRLALVKSSFDAPRGPPFRGYCQRREFTIFMHETKPTSKEKRHGSCTDRSGNRKESAEGAPGAQQQLLPDRGTLDARRTGDRQESSRVHVDHSTDRRDRRRPRNQRLRLRRPDLRPAFKRLNLELSRPCPHLVT